VGELTDKVLRDIQRLLKKSPNNNIMIITTQEQLQSVSPDMIQMCGIVTDAKVKILNMRDKMLMLHDERVIAFDHLVVNGNYQDESANDKV